tara:strand:- start:1873 stop:2361 length:489 start_codon:yes stop_codon:yes gene_type:complete
MQYKNNTKQRLGAIQGLRSFKDTLPKNIKKVINNRGQIYSEILNNWKFIAGEILFKVCYPKSFKNSNKFGVSTLLVKVKRGHEIDLEYSKKEIVDRINNFFGRIVVEKIRFNTFEEDQKIYKDVKSINANIANNKYINKIENVKNDKIKKSLLELTKVFKEK